MDWRDHFTEDFCMHVVGALLEPGECGILGGFAPDEQVGPLSGAIIEMICDAVSDLWVTQLGDGMSALRVADVLDSLGLSDRNLAFVRRLQEALDSMRDSLAVDEQVLESLVDRAKRRRQRDLHASYEFRKTGDFWTIRFNGEFTALKDAVGLIYIAHLLAQPGKKILAPYLLSAVTGELSVRRVGSAGAQTDQKTLADVKQKYLEAQEELEEAERNNDFAAQDRLQGELDGLADYLKTVKGFGGRTREASDDADKIRRAMTQAIGRTIDSLGASDKLPAAARHLQNAIKTGLFMSYEPEKELPWSL